MDIDKTNLSHDTRGTLDARGDIQYALNQLSLEHREAIEMIFYLGLSYEEASEIIGCPVGTVKSRVFHAKKLLGYHLSPGRRG